MNSTSAIPIGGKVELAWKRPSRGVVGMACLIFAESAIFIIFVVAYIYYLSKSTSGPTPAQVLELPIAGTICLLSSSITIHLATGALRKQNVRKYTIALAATIVLGAIFILSTAREWYHLVYDAGLTLRTNLFGTTYYALVGLHATHVVVGLLLLTIALLVSLGGLATEKHSERVEVLSMYWHFVDAVWIAVFLVVYVLGR
jgi:cytochrome c oxidase subunit 3